MAVYVIKEVMLNKISKKSTNLLLLLVLYLGFISLGLPDQVLGVAWLDMRHFFNKPLDYAGVLVFTTTLFTILSSFCSGFFVKRFSVQTILIGSCVLTAFALLGYGFSSSWVYIILFSVILGSGAGTIDAVLNDYVAKNYSPKHMNWLHACWGIGATLGPAIMTFAIASTSNWRIGYFIIGSIQVCLLIIFIAAKKLWKKQELASCEKETQKPNLFTLAPMLSALFFLFYVALESSIGLWFYSVLVENRGVEKGLAGALVVVYWASLTCGRFVVGLISEKISCSKIITIGIYGVIVGILMLFVHNLFLTALALVLIGFCLSGLYPCMMSETAHRFDNETALVLTGYQVGAAGIGFAVLTPLVGVFINNTNLSYFINIILLFGCVLLIIDSAIRSILKGKISTNV